MGINNWWMHFHAVLCKMAYFILGYMYMHFDIYTHKVIYYLVNYDYRLLMISLPSYHDKWIQTTFHLEKRREKWVSSCAKHKNY